MKNKIDYINADTKKALLQMTIPLLVSLTLSMTYSLVDSLWIGNLLGEKAMAALTSSTAVILLLNCIVVGFTNGIAILLAQAIGAKDEKRVAKIKSTSFILSLCMIILVIGACEFAVIPVLKLLHTPAKTFSMSCWYLRVYLIGFLPMYFYMYFTTILRCYGNTIFQMLAITICTILNAFLDPLFMKLIGFNGVALATVVTQSISLLLSIIYVRKKNCFKFSRSDIDQCQIHKIFAKAIPSVVQQSIPAISTMALTSFVSGYGMSAIAAFGVIGKMENILLYPVMALNMGLTTIVSRCIGSKRTDRMRDYIKAGMIFGGISLCVFTAILVIFSKDISWLFVQKNAIGKIVRNYFLIAGLGYVIHVITTCFIAGLNGMGRTFTSMLLYIFYFLCIRVPVAYLLSKTFGYGLNGIWSAFIISHVVAVCTAAVLFICEKRKFEKSLCTANV